MDAFSAVPCTISAVWAACAASCVLVVDLPTFVNTDTSYRPFRIRVTIIRLLIPACAVFVSSIALIGVVARAVRTAEERVADELHVLLASPPEPGTRA